MKLNTLLHPKLIFLDLDFTKKDDVINFLIDRMCKEYKFSLPVNDIKGRVFEREALGGTAFETGIAIPHGRLPDFDDTVIAVGKQNNPIECEGHQISFFFLILTSQAGSQFYLQTLSCLASLSRDRELFTNLIQTSDTGVFRDYLNETYIKKSLTIEDIMTSNVISITPGATLKELADLFYSKNIAYVPVIDKGTFVGEVTINELLKVGLPNYAMMIGNLNFLQDFSPFENLLKNEESIYVKEIMRKPSLKLAKGTSIIEAALELTQNNRRTLPVVEGNTLVGVISFTDILQKIIRR